MQIHTYRVRSLAEAIRRVREELGPDAALLHTRQVSSPLARWFGVRTIEVTASADAQVPSRLPAAESLPDFSR
jgi:flagellar biosynthesis protein FlhF